MLRQIQSNVFRKNPILVHKGLNVVLGDTQGSNSIGKSTLLMIIDFIFGGSSYIEKNKDVVRNLGHHCFEFVLEFEDVLHYFRRNTENYELVELCNEKFSNIKTWTIKEYKNFLHRMYMQNNDEITFRSTVGVFSRVAQKENFFNSKPLKVVSNSKEIEGINNLIKLFGYYKNIEEIEKDIKVLNKKITIINGANKYKYLKRITTNQYESNKKYIEKNLVNLNKVATQFSFNFSEFLDINYQHVQKQLYDAKKQKEMLSNKLKRVDNNIQNSSKIEKKNFEPLEKYFKGVNISKLQEIEKFHKGLNNILLEEFYKAKANLEEKLEEVEQQIQQIEQQILDINNQNNIPNRFVQPLVDLISNINDKKQENEIYEEYISKKQDKEEKEQSLAESKRSTLESIEREINDKMQELNELIYGKENKAPKFKITEKEYFLTLPDNTGTARGYANLIIFDISILKLTVLPIIIHDSVMFKNIGNIPMAKIIKIYNDEEKQCFISIDEITKFDSQCQEVLETKKIIKLSDKETLFTKDWTKEIEKN